MRPTTCARRARAEVSEAERACSPRTSLRVARSRRQRLQRSRNISQSTRPRRAQASQDHQKRATPCGAHEQTRPKHAAAINGPLMRAATDIYLRRYLQKSCPPPTSARHAWIRLRLRLHPSNGLRITCRTAQVYRPSNWERARRSVRCMRVLDPSTGRPSSPYRDRSEDRDQRPRVRRVETQEPTATAPSARRPSASDAFLQPSEELSTEPPLEREAQPPNVTTVVAERRMTVRIGTLRSPR